MAGHVITFYSYKGGTGRTMALANAAVVLARDRGARVLAIDWDLEAPGLHRFLDDGETGNRPGLIELFTRARDRLAATVESERAAVATSLWGELPLDRHIAATQISTLSVMQAGCMDASYQARMNGFDWEQLYHDAPELFAGFADALATRYDYVLIDSRTGLTDTGGICTMLLPDRLVVVFTPNRQSLAGVVHLARQATDYRRRSDDLRPLVVFPLASRVEQSEDELRRTWRYGAADRWQPSPPDREDDPYLDGYQPIFEQLFGEVYDLPRCDLESYFDEVQIQHSPRLAYGEPIAVLEERASDRLSLARSYTTFTGVLADTGGPWEYRGRASADVSDGGEDLRAIAQLDETIDVLRTESRRGRAFQLQVRLLQGGLVVVGLMAAILLQSDPYSQKYSSFVAVGGVLLGAVVELIVRSWRPPDRYLTLGAAAAALVRERRLFQAGAGPYAGADAPSVVLTERTDDILARVDDATWGVRSFRRLDPPV
jgi:cellulose biosynthesis protein BcsQ